MPRSLQGSVGVPISQCRHAGATQPSTAGLAHSTSHHKYPGRTRGARHGSQGRSTLIASLACWPAILHALQHADLADRTALCPDCRSAAQGAARRCCRRS